MKIARIQAASTARESKNTFLVVVDHITRIEFLGDEAIIYFNDGFPIFADLTEEDAVKFLHGAR